MECIGSNTQVYIHIIGDHQAAAGMRMNYRMRSRVTIIIFTAGKDKGSNAYSNVQKIPDKQTEFRHNYLM